MGEFRANIGEGSSHPSHPTCLRIISQLQVVELSCIVPTVVALLLSVTGPNKKKKTPHIVIVGKHPDQLLDRRNIHLVSATPPDGVFVFVVGTTDQPLLLLDTLDHGFPGGLVRQRLRLDMGT